jgi:hypothetical protein
VSRKDQAIVPSIRRKQKILVGFNFEHILDICSGGSSDENDVLPYERGTQTSPCHISTPSGVWDLSKHAADFAIYLHSLCRGGSNWQGFTEIAICFHRFIISSEYERSQIIGRCFVIPRDCNERGSHRRMSQCYESRG